MKLNCKLYLLFTLIILLPSASYTAEDITQRDTSDLETRVRNILAKDNVSQRSEVNDIFLLADIYAAKNNIPKAREFYEAGLAIDSFRLDYQLKLANLLNRLGDVNQAIEKYKSIYAYAEDEHLINSAKGYLRSLKVNCPSPSQNNGKYSIIVVPFGKINRVLVDELLSELNRTTGIKYTLSEKQLPLGNLDRTYAAWNLSKICDKIKSESESPDMNIPPDTDPNAQLNFVISLLYAENVSQKKIDNFRAKMISDFQNGQRNADRLISELKAAFTSVNKPHIMGFLGITEADIYSDDNNFLFGWAQPRFGIMSYFRFKADFNEEPQCRPRLIKRAVKQGISSTFFILGIPRCTNAMCVRAYPHSLEEQDIKESQLCSWCKEQLSKKLTSGNK